MNKVIIIINEYAIYILQFFAILVIITGVLKAMWIFLGDAFIKGKAVKAIVESHLELGHSFSLGLGFLIGASILKSTLTPTWNDIG